MATLDLTLAALRLAGLTNFTPEFGTKEADGKVLTSGGRVLSVTGMGKTLREAVNNAYAGVDKIAFEKAFHRTDIAHRAFERG